MQYIELIAITDTQETEPIGKAGMKHLVIHMRDNLDHVACHIAHNKS